MTETLPTCWFWDPEDGAICTAVQRNLEAGIYDTGLPSPRNEGAA